MRFSNLTFDFYGGLYGAVGCVSKKIQQRLCRFLLKTHIKEYRCSYAYKYKYVEGTQHTVPLVAVGVLEKLFHQFFGHRVPHEGDVVSR